MLLINFSICVITILKFTENSYLKWIETYQPGALLLHAGRASRSHQDLSVEGAGAVYTNPPYWIEFLDERLHTPRDNILQENIFIIL